MSRKDVGYCLLKNCTSFFSYEFETYEAAQNNPKTYKSEKLDLSLSVCLFIHSNFKIHFKTAVN